MILLNKRQLHFITSKIHPNIFLAKLNSKSEIRKIVDKFFFVKIAFEFGDSLQLNLGAIDNPEVKDRVAVFLIMIKNKNHLLFITSIILFNFKIIDKLFSVSLNSFCCCLKSVNFLWVFNQISFGLYCRFLRLWEFNFLEERNSA